MGASSVTSYIESGSGVAIKLARGKPGEVHLLLYGVAILFALAFVVAALQGLP